MAEFILLLAALFSMVAFSIDSILPALPEIASHMVPDNVNRAQLVITAFVVGAGLGQLFFGPLADAFGRRLSMASGFALYMFAAAAAFGSQSLEALLFWRFVQGLGAAGPRTNAMALTRDLYEGRTMAKVNSMAFTFFVLVPAVAPLIGQSVILSFGWRHMFTTYVLVAFVILLWFLIRQPETHLPENRRSMRLKPMIETFGIVLSNRTTVLYMMIITLAFGQLMSYLSSAQQIFVDVLGTGTSFPLYFALVTLLSAISGFLNSILVIRFGMRRLALIGFVSQTILASATLLYWSVFAPEGNVALWVFVIWSTSLFALNGLSFGNLNALAMQPLGHVAGTAAALIGALPTMLAVLIAAPVGLAFNGTPEPLLIGVTLCSALSVLLIQTDRKNPN
ncbi:multidrug effflux MFS transporter [Aliiroseovarius sp. KMU-50]|uniref:Multidrug effflux MFS transporter n=1 Tax=Aliiroseovarius salicola TaxID=3009082 RepID=A0ABT4W2S5_9RHOB|nr:multidrug effflux MFS transporter [Aliiroseovarius sp. KMU-50]MDA5094805.1 multidrug effflux MFS transporter [Aliiroseovarius sp. KMU-50]